MILATDCRLAIESNMISHAPEGQRKTGGVGDSGC